MGSFSSSYFLFTSLTCSQLRPLRTLGPARVRIHRAEVRQPAGVPAHDLLTSAKLDFELQRDPTAKSSMAVMVGTAAIARQ
eukprot:768267-Hanusia_phi.AAC.6